jgi:cyanophycinase
MLMSTRLGRSLSALLLVALTLAACAPSSGDEPAPDPATAVPNGTLMLAGGAAETELYAEFARLAGGANAQIVYVPTAAQSVDIDETWAYVRKMASGIGAAPENMTVLHTRDTLVADTDSFAAPLQSADAVWFAGGRQWRIYDAYAGTKTLEGFWSVLDRGGVIGGSSAGATIQGSFLVRGDTKTNEVMMGDHQEGFGFLPQSAVDQHLLARDRQYDLIPVIEAHPDLLGIGLDENTAIVVQGDTARVVGESVVAFYDYRRWAEADSTLDPDDKFFFLKPGDRLDLRTRQKLTSVANEPVSEQ